MNRRTAITSLLALCFVGAGCDKGEPRASGPLSEADQELFKFLPQGETALLGGGYVKLQQFMQSNLGKAATQAMDKLGNGMAEWMACWAKLDNLKLAASANIAEASEPEVRMVLSGAGIAELTRCANNAGFKFTADADGKFVGIEIPGPQGTTTAGYLALPGGAIYSRGRFAVGGGTPMAANASRSELEADIAALAKGNANADAKLQALVAKVDRTKTLWFAGSGVGTPLAAELGDVYGTIDIDSGISVDANFQVVDPAMAAKVDDGIRRAKSMDELPADFREILQNLKFQRTGDEMHVSLKVSDSQLARMLQQSGIIGRGVGQ